MRTGRSHDDLDFLALLDELTGTQRAWLSHAISRVNADHPWLTRLSG